MDDVGHTREEASALWCPMVRMPRWEFDEPRATGDHTLPRVIGGCNSGGHSARNPSSCRCIADACAMWRWSESETIGVPSQYGYCGLAGRPT